ncbi:MAG: PAS domain-containing sensor histidine kinase [Candidatus Eiseniibacteriota bacterium]
MTARRTADLYDDAPDMFVSVDARTGEVVECNRTLLGALSRTREEVIGRPVSELCAPESREAAQRALEQVQETGSARDVELRVLRRDGSVIRASMNASAVRDESGRVLYSRCILRDITELRRLEEDAARREAELAHVTRLSTLGELIAGIAHEVNQPLQSITLFAGACEESLRRGAEPERVLPWIRQIADQARSCGAIVARIRAFARKADGERTRFDIAPLVSESVALLDFEARRCGVSVELELDPEGEVVADRLQIQQVVVNLLRNSYEASLDAPPGERLVTVRTRSRDDGVEIAFEDRGAGVPADVGERIFEAFYTSKRDGLGMGLTISRSIVDAHGGRLAVASNPGRGSTATVLLPRGDPGAGPPR